VTELTKGCAEDHKRCCCTKWRLASLLLQAHLHHALQRLLVLCDAFVYLFITHMVVPNDKAIRV
jgi:hypothetical protein